MQGTAVQIEESQSLRVSSLHESMSPWSVVLHVHACMHALPSLGPSGLGCHGMRGNVCVLESKFDDGWTDGRWMMDVKCQDGGVD